MAYYRRRRRTSYRRPSRSGSYRRYSRRSTARRSRAQRIVIQVVGGTPGMAAPVSLGMKTNRVVRRRF